MPYQITISPKKIFKYLTLIVILLALASIPVQIGKYVFDYRAAWTRMFNLDREMNLPTWYSTLMLAFSALLLRIIAINKNNQHERYFRHWKFLSILFIFLALDELFQIHEIFIIKDISRMLPGIFYSVWVIPYGIGLIIFAQKYWKFTRDLPKQTRFHFILAAILYIGGALGMEIVGSYWTDLEGQQNLVYALMATLEEVMEMMGIIVWIYGLLIYIQKLQSHLNINIKISD
ncbi:MAG: hypothetical protein WA933_05495 [Microcoleaceae cyanobacterium]